MPPQMPPPQGQSPQMPPEGGEGKGQVQALVEGIHTDLMKFMELVEGADPAVAQKLAAVVQGFQAVVQELVGGGVEKPEAPPTPGQSPQGPRAVPM